MTVLWLAASIIGFLAIAALLALVLTWSTPGGVAVIVIGYLAVHIVLVRRGWLQP